MRTLAIETSCDDTSVGIVSYDGTTFVVEELLAYSQIDDHQKYGGVVPELASRLHSEKIVSVLESLGMGKLDTIDTISVTTHPGLPGALVVGRTAAHFLAERYQKPLVEVNHIYGHIFSLLLERSFDDLGSPMVVLTASGGHNDIYLIEHQDQKFVIKKLGQTLDDAAGECFDKVSRMLGGPYPGGKWIADMALLGKNLSQEVVSEFQDIVNFKRVFLAKDGYDFSFSGMKSQVSLLLKKLEKQNIPLGPEVVQYIAYEFQEAMVEILTKKLLQAVKFFEAKTVGICGGVSANDRLAEYLQHQIEKKFNPEFVVVPKFLKPTKKIYSTDNAAMIGVAGILKHLGMIV